MNTEKEVKDYIDGLIWDVVYTDRRTQAADRKNYSDENSERVEAWHRLEGAIAKHYTFRPTLDPKSEARLLSGDEQIDVIRALVGLFDDQGAVIGDVGPVVNRAYEVLSHAALLHPVTEAVARLLWHRFAPDHHMDWEEEPHKAEYLDAASDVIFRARVRHRDAVGIEKVPK